MESVQPSRVSLGVNLDPDMLVTCDVTETQYLPNSPKATWANGAKTWAIRRVTLTSVAFRIMAIVSFQNQDSTLCFQHILTEMICHHLIKASCFQNALESFKNNHYNNFTR